MQRAGNALRAKLCRPSAGSTGATGALPAAALVRGPRHCAASLALPPPPPVSAGGRRRNKLGSRQVYLFPSWAALFNVSELPFPPLRAP